MHPDRNFVNSDIRCDIYGNLCEGKQMDVAKQIKIIIQACEQMCKKEPKKQFSFKIAAYEQIKEILEKKE